VVEVPPLELETDFDIATTDAGHEVDDEPLVIDEAPRHPSFIQTEDDTSISTGGRKSGFIDLGIDEISSAGDQAGSLVFSNIEETPAAPDIDELESRVADNPDDPESHQALGEALVEQGDRERGIEELDFATSGFENAGNLAQARDLVDEVLRIDPNSVRHRQKAVEFAFKAGDKARLVDAYLELADALLRSDLPEKARRVRARGRARPQERAGQGGHLDARAGRRPAARKARRQSQGQGREDESPRRGRTRRRLRRPGLHVQRRRRREHAGQRHAHDRRR
jgi:hypothetical protein